MGNILKKMGWDRTSYVVCVKYFLAMDVKNLIKRAKSVTWEACHDALRRLQVDYLDLFFCHRPDRNTPIEETVRAMNTLIEQGKVLYWGTSEWNAQQITEARCCAHQNYLIGPLMEQPQYNMFHRERFEVDLCPY